MAQASTTATGTIVLAGDLTGSDAHAPQLAPTGVTALSSLTDLYRKIYINNKGQLIWVSPDRLVLPTLGNASTTAWGIMKPGDGIDIDGSSVISISHTFTDPSDDATTSIKGIVQVGSNISVTGGVISVPYASTSQFGIGSAGANIAISSGSISTSIGSTSTRGLIKIGSNISVSSGVISIPIADASTFGLIAVQQGNGLTTNAGLLTYSTSTILSATTGHLGMVMIGSGLTVSSGVVSIDTSAYPNASNATPGLMIVGSNLNVSSGVISVNIPPASSTVRGYAQIGSGLSVTGGLVSANVGSSTSQGIVQIGSGLSVNSGIIDFDTSSLSISTSTSKGLIQVGNGFAVSAGTITVDNNTFPKASNTEFGVVLLPTGNRIVNDVDGLRIGSWGHESDISISGAASTEYNYPSQGINTAHYGFVKSFAGTGFNITNGVLSSVATTTERGCCYSNAAGYGIDVATDGTINAQVAPNAAMNQYVGLVKVGTGFVVDGSGAISVTGLTDGSTSTPGIISVGSGLNITSGVLSYSAPTATTSTKGLVQVSATGNISVSSGTISIPEATTTVKGLVQAGNGVNILSGVISIDTSTFANATTTSRGIMQVGAGIDISSAIISIPKATTTNFGTVKPSTGFNLAVDGTLSLVSTTSLSLGLMKVGSYLSATSGVVSVNLSTLPATDTIYGVIKVGSGLTDDGLGTVSLDTSPIIASTTTFGLMQVGTGLTVASGVVAFDNSQFTDATSSTTGTFTLGNGITVATGNATLNVATINATTSVKGLVQPISTYFTVTAGVVNFTPSSVPNATSSTYGLMKVGTNLLVSSGVVSTAFPTGTTAAIGLVQPGTYLSVDVNGTLSLDTSDFLHTGELYVCTKAIVNQINGNSTQYSYGTYTTNTTNWTNLGTNSLQEEVILIHPYADNFNMSKTYMPVTNFIIDPNVGGAGPSTWDAAYRFPSGMNASTLHTKYTAISGGGTFTVINNGTYCYLIPEFLA